jgi:hypothetical protein
VEGVAANGEFGGDGVIDAEYSASKDERKRKRAAIDRTSVVLANRKLIDKKLLDCIL